MAKYTKKQVLDEMATARVSKLKNPSFGKTIPTAILSEFAAIGTAMALTASIDRLVRECKNQKRALRVSIEILPASSKEKVQ
jgi:hypothetical protein